MTTTWRRRALASGAAATLVVGVGIAGLPMSAVAKPAAAKISFLNFSPGIQTLTSTTHKHLRIQLSTTVSVQGGSTFTGADIVVTRKGVPEVHTWIFRLKNGSVKFNPKTAKGSVTSGSQLAPYAKLALTLARAGKSRTVKCGTFRTITQPVSVHGVLSFNTRSTGKGRWGKVHTSAKYHFSGKSVVVYETGAFQSCGGNFTLPCTSDVSWEVAKSGANDIDVVALSGTIEKVHGKTVSTLFASRNQALSKPKGAVREDDTTISDKRMVFTVLAGNKARMTVGGSGPVTGSATLTSPQPGTNSSFGCGKTGQTQTTTDWSVPYKNGKSPLAVHEQIEGTYGLHNLPIVDTGEDSIDRSVVS